MSGKLLEMMQRGVAGNFSEADLRAGFEGYRRLRETQTTDSFPELFADTIDRQLLVGYQEAPADFMDYIREGRVPDFRDVKRKRVSGLEGRLSKVGEKEEYPVGAKDETKYEYAVEKYGKTYDISWESIINDDLGALRDDPNRLGRGARRTEYYFATTLFADSALRGGGEFFENNRNALIGQGADLDPDNLAELYTMAMEVKDEDDEPIFNEPRYLVVPPSLRLTAMDILNSTVMREMLTTDVEGERNNYWSQLLELRVNHYIPIVDDTDGDDCWFLFSDPADVPAIEMGWLTGHEQPEVFMKAPDAMPVDGAGDPWAGDFDTDNIKFKVRHVIGGTQLDWRGAFMSDGQ